MNGYPDHTNSIRRLNRIAGQIEGIKKMIEDRRYCPEILSQLKAVSCSTRSLEAEILKGHLEGCVKQCFAQNDADTQQQKIHELIELFKKN